MAAALGAATMGWALLDQRRRRLIAESERQHLAQQLDRRINEIFSLQELSYVLAESLQLERVAEQVARYTLRFLQAEGAAVILATEDGGHLSVAAAEGSLRPLSGQQLLPEEATLVMLALRNERIEVAQEENGTIPVLGTATARNAAAAPLRAHGFTMGALAVTDRRSGGFSAEDLWLLSTVTTHVAVVMANSRLFEMVRQAKEEWETAFNSLAEGIAVVDGTGKISRANRALGRLLDAAVPTLIGRPFWQTVVGEPDAEGDLLASARRGERPVPAIVRSTILDRVLRLTAAPLSEPLDGTATVILLEDVTEQRALEAQLIQNEKLAAVGQLVSGVAHELNNPLTSIAGLAEFLLERGSLPAADREHLRVIHEQAERAGRIVQNLLTFARKGGSAESEAVNLRDVVERTTALVAYELHLRSVELVQQLGSDPVTVRGNRYELQQVVLNLLTNAVQAMRDLPSGRPRRLCIEAVRESQAVVLRVSDTGPGVPARLVPQLFTPFFTTKDPGEGTGLGLSISYGIAESHGGKLSYAPAVGGGAEFTLTLPFARVSQDELRAIPFLPTAAGAQPRTILLVDDDPSVHRVVSALFEPSGDRVTAVLNGDEGLALAKQDEFDLIIADARAASGGRRFLDALAAERPAWRERVIVTVPDDGSAGRLRQDGFRVVARPFTARQLKEAAGE